jgi:hypothetical protein
LPDQLRARERIVLRTAALLRQPHVLRAAGRLRRRRAEPGLLRASLPCERAKHDITPIDPDQILERIASMPISEWSYNEHEPSVRHIGPMAQDFHAAFGVGSSDKCIPTVDENGVALAAIQALYQRVERLDQEGRDLRQKNEALRREVDRLRGEAHR